MGRPVSKDRIEFYIKGRERMAEPYHLKAIGLSNIYLLNGITFGHDEEYGNTVYIENLKGLHRAIGLHIIETASYLSGDEFRFLRKQMGLTQKELGERLGISDQTIANYEKGATSSIGPAEFALRVGYLLHILPDEARAKLVKSMFEEQGKRNKRKRLPDVPRRNIVQGWHECAFAAA